MPDFAAVQARNPKKDLPISIIGSLTLATTLVRPPAPFSCFKHSAVPKSAGMAGMSYCCRLKSAMRSSASKSAYTWAV